MKSMIAAVVSSSVDLISVLLAEPLDCLLRLDLTLDWLRDSVVLTTNVNQTKLMLPVIAVRSHKLAEIRIHDWIKEPEECQQRENDKRRMTN